MRSSTNMVAFSLMPKKLHNRSEVEVIQNVFISEEIRLQFVSKNFAQDDTPDSSN